MTTYIDNVNFAACVQWIAAETPHPLSDITEMLFNSAGIAPVALEKHMNGDLGPTDAIPFIETTKNEYRHMMVSELEELGEDFEPALKKIATMNGVPRDDHASLLEGGPFRNPPVGFVDMTPDDEEWIKKTRTKAA